MGERLSPVPVDIETTGFEITDKVTVLGFSLPLGCRVFLYTDSRPVKCEHVVESLEMAFDTTVNLTAHDSQQELLEEVGVFVDERLRSREYMLVAYNGELYRGGFDLPFLRSRYTRSDIDWPFDRLPFADLMPIFQHRFNTRSECGDQSDLEGVYEVLIGDGLTEKDPFKTSETAVTAFSDGEFKTLLAHNIADLLRTDALAALAQEYCGTSEFDLKSLTPTSRDPALNSHVHH